MYSKILEEYFSSSSGVMVDLVEDRKMLLVLCERYGSVVRISLHGVMGGGHLWRHIRRRRHKDGGSLTWHQGWSCWWLRGRSSQGGRSGWGLDKRVSGAIWIQQAGSSSRLCRDWACPLAGEHNNRIVLHQKGVWIQIDGSASLLLLGGCFIKLIRLQMAKTAYSRLRIAWPVCLLLLLLLLCKSSRRRRSSPWERASLLLLLLNKLVRTGRRGEDVKLLIVAIGEALLSASRTNHCCQNYF